MSPDQQISLVHLRATVKELMDHQEYKSALFWADKVVCLSSGDVNDVLMQAQCLFHLKEYHRTVHCIKSRDLHVSSLACRHLVAKAHYVAKEFKEASEVISDFEDDYCGNETTASGSEGKSKGSLSTVTPCDLDEERKWKSSICLLKGQIFESLDNRTLAAQCFREALKYNVYNFEAFQCLTQHQMLSRSEEEDVLLQIDPQDGLTKLLYSSLLKKYASPADEVVLVADAFNEKLQENTDVMTCKAEAAYYQCDYYQCIKLTTEVLNRDVYHAECLPIHISCLMELKETNRLFDLAHRLVDLYPESAISWYAVGCYYLMINKSDAARRYLNKATTLDPVFGPAWLLYGHSFAVASEHDQAMAAYFKASHLMKGCHLPLLYIGLEYGQTENTKLAEKFFNQALLIAPSDPFVLHELGFVSFQNQDFEAADRYFTRALNVIKHKKDITRLPEKWEPLLNNMGHTLRKMKRYEESLDYHRQAMVLSPHNGSTYAAIGFDFALMCKWNESVEYFHKALALKRDDTFINNMLSQTIDQLIHSMTLFSDLSLPYDPIKSSSTESQSTGSVAETTDTPIEMDVSGE